MKHRGGYNIGLAGRPAGRVEVLPEPDVLYVPLRSRRFSFTERLVQEGQSVRPGHALARDPANYRVPLLAPRAGTVQLESVAGHVVLTGVERAPEGEYEPGEELAHAPRRTNSSGARRLKLLELGAWQFFSDAFSGRLPDPLGTPQAVIVSTVQFEPYMARGDVHVRKRLASFTRGLEHLQSLLEYQPIYLVLPDVESELAKRVRDALRGYAWVRPVEVPRRYGVEHAAVLARKLGLKQQVNQPVWAVGAAGVLAVDRALTMARPATVRLVSLGGPSVNEPRHLKAMAGYPIDAILQGRLSHEPVRNINGGILSGQQLDEQQRGLDAECTGLTVLPEHTQREMLGFMRPGWGRRSYSRCFLSVLRPRFAERLTTALRGERRPCISCNFCEEVCPAGIMPHLIHKYLYQEALEEAERAGINRCVGCGLCSFVCPSKIELRSQMLDGQETVQRELHGEEAEAAS